MSSEDEEEYIVSAILDHKLFKDLVEESLKSKCKFSPGSIEEDRHRHSKYGYLVHWENYSMKERTWEPESNLKKLLKLQEYKEKIGLPDNHEKYDYHYGANVWRQLGLAAERVDGFRYLMSAKEKAEAKAEKYRKLQALNATAKAKREKENTRQRMVTPEDPESGVKERKKQKKLEQMGVESFDFRIPRKSTSDTSQTQVECEVVRPSISLSELNLKIPRIPKKVSASVSTPQASHATLDTPNPNPFYDPCELRQVYASSSSESMSTLPTRLKDFTQPLKPEDFKVKKRPRVLIPAKEQEEMQRKLRIKDIRKNLISIREQLKKYPVEISATRATRSFSTALQLVKLRRCQSSERLNERWMTNAEMEILGNNFERMEILERKKPKKFTKVWTAEAPTPIIDVPRECFVVSSLFHKNWKQVESVITRINIKLHANFLKLLELLIRAFSEDDAMQFEQIFCEQFPDNSKFDGFKYMAIVLISTQCRHKLWPNDKEGKSLVESTCTVDEIRRQEVTCSESHRKCLWMEVFLKLLPDKMRFLETSGKGLNGDVEEADGPFRDDIFFHCMRHGAECQKILFFKYSKPIGIQEDTIDDFSVDVMHLLAVQHGNLQRIGWYLSQGGIDINALATHLPTNNVLRLQEYLKVWSEMHVKEELHKKYYQRLVELVRFTADMLEIFVENQVMQMIGRKMAGRWKIQMDLTYPHILRCSPLSNRSNGGDGTHQVLSCLFYPQSIGLRDGLPPRDENDVFEADRVERLRMSLRKYQKLVMDRKGRLVLAVLRIDIGFCAQVAKNQPYSLPTFKLIESDEGFEIEKMTHKMDDEDMSCTSGEDYGGYGDEDYYNEADVDAADDVAVTPTQSEEADYECLSVLQVERVFNDGVKALVGRISVNEKIGKMLLQANNWDVDTVVKSFRSERIEFLRRSHVDARQDGARKVSSSALQSGYCSVCAMDGYSQLPHLTCGHCFCEHCWKSHVESRLSEGVAARIECMESECEVYAPSEFVFVLLESFPFLKSKYERFLLRDMVNAHPQLKFCVGNDCSVIVRSTEAKPKRVTCQQCHTSFCVKCGADYHAPTSCQTIKEWMTKCADDSETANYISAHTKDCPQCHSCIEKAGGCNHIQCTRCRHHFCWMCFGDWKSHGSEYYECSRYKENPSVAAEANHVKARRALEKYLHYFERFENHSKSLKMEEELRDKIRKKIDDKVNEHNGTWIDWQYLHKSVSLLTKCRYTLQYTYPFAYYLQAGPRKNLFEYQQAQLEKEVEELAWAVERADGTARGALEAHMHRAEHKRQTLLHDFFF